MNHFQPHNFMLLPTLSCQGSCVYCLGLNKGLVLDGHTADKTVGFIFRIVPKDGNIHITFHGGEPLLTPASWYRHILPQLRSRFGRRFRLSVQSNLLPPLKICSSSSRNTRSQSAQAWMGIRRCATHSAETVILERTQLPGIGLRVVDKRNCVVDL